MAAHRLVLGPDAVAVAAPEPSRVCDPGAAVTAVMGAPFVAVKTGRQAPMATRPPV